MKIAICYPPIESDKGVPLLSQNRQFQWFNAPTYVYPMVPAYCATNLQRHGHQVSWLDGIAAGWTYEEFCGHLGREAPDMIVMETKTPVVNKHREIVKDLKRRFRGLQIVMVGDYVTSNLKDAQDLWMCVAGGYYDFDLPLILGARDVSSRRDLDDLPMIDRDLTRWQLYAYDNGNFKHKPGTYVYSGRDCWWGKCSFCVWDHTLYPKGSYRVHSPERMLDEVGDLVERYEVREIFDDAGTLAVGKWLDRFCHGMIDRGYNKRVRFGCNMKPGHLIQSEYDLMAEAGFRFILFGVESANDETLRRLDKGNTVQDIEDSLRMASRAGLEPHITVMFGYPWETREDAKRTVDFARRMFRKGYIDTLQGTVVIPYPGTPLYRECVENGWLLTQDWERFDMREPVMRTPMPPEEVMGYVRSLYRAFISPRYILRKLFAIRNLEDIKFLVGAAKKFFGHLLDFKKGG